MKNLKYIAIITGLTFSLFSCNKDVLETSPIDNLDFTITDGKSAQAALYGTYNNLKNDNYYGYSFQAIGYLSGDNTKWTGSLNYYNNFVAHNVSSDNSLISTVFSGIYKTINSANIVINGLPAITDASLSSANRNRYLGEAYFIRALSYFDLARTWGGVQLVLSPTVDVNSNTGIKRSSLSDTYTQVLSDLNQAESLLPAHASSDDRNRANQYAVYALRARLHLYQQDWVDAETDASKVIADSANYSLVSTFSNYFKTKLTSESVLELAYSSSSTNTHYYYWLRSGTGTYGGGRREWAPSDSIVKILKDKKRGGNRISLIDTTVGSPVVAVEYWRSGTKDDPAYILRIAEQYLIRAEARAQQGNLSGALKDLNRIRYRAGLTASTAATQSEILLAIENERRIEFAFEPHRWFDLVRTSRAGNVLGVTNTQKWVYPIPYAAIQADPDLTDAQNPGY